jgi:hypothetical protein
VRKSGPLAPFAFNLRVVRIDSAIRNRISDLGYCEPHRSQKGVQHAHFYRS